MKQKILIQVEIDYKDYKLLDSYGFDWQRNFYYYVKGIANEMREALKEKKNGTR